MDDGWMDGWMMGGWMMGGVMDGWVMDGWINPCVHSVPAWASVSSSRAQCPHPCGYICLPGCMRPAYLLLHFSGESTIHLIKVLGKSQ